MVVSKESLQLNLRMNSVCGSIVFKVDAIMSPTCWHGVGHAKLNQPVTVDIGERHPIMQIGISIIQSEKASFNINAEIIHQTCFMQCRNNPFVFVWFEALHMQ